MALESWFRTTLAVKLAAADVSMYIATAPTITNGRIYLKSSAQEERIKFTGVTPWTPAILTGLTRGMSKTANPSTGSTGKDRVAGTPVKIVAMHDQIADKTDLLSWPNTWTGAQTFNNITVTGTADFGSIGDLNVLGTSNPQPNFVDLAALQAFYTSPQNGDKGTANWVDYSYNWYTVQWEAKWVSTPVPPASTSVQGSVKVTTALSDPDQVAGVYNMPTNSLVTAGIENSKTDTIVSLTAWENITIGDNLCFGNTSASENPLSTATDSNFSFWGNSVMNAAQKITMSGVGYLQKITTVKYKLYKTGTPVDNVVMKLYNDDLVTIIDTSSSVAWWTLSWSAVEQTFTFSGNQNLIPWKSYYIVLCRSWAEDNSNYYRWLYNTTWGSSEMYLMDWVDWSLWFSWWAAAKLAYDIAITTYAVNPASVMKMDANDPLLIQDAGIATETKTTGQAVKVQMSGVVATNGFRWTTVNDSTNISDDSTLSTTDSYWYTFTVAWNTWIARVAKVASCNATRCRLMDSVWTVLATATFSGDYASFAYILSAGTYKVEADNSWVAYNSRFKTVPTAFPVAGTNITLTTWSKNWWADTQWHNIDVIEAYSITTYTPNLYYYASDTAGALSTTPSTTYNIRIGKAISATSLLIDKKKISSYIRIWNNTDTIYNGAAVNYNKGYSNKYIRVFTGYRPTKITNCFYSNWAVLYYGTSYCDWVLNEWWHVLTTANTVVNPDSWQAFIMAYEWGANVLSGTINFLNNGFEIYYNKSADAIFVDWYAQLKCFVE